MTRIIGTRAPKREGEERKRLILESAQTVFANSNYAKVGTADLARAAGISEPALYRYFSGKKDLYRSTLKMAGARLLEIWQQVGRASKNPLDVLWTLGLGYYDHLQNRSPVLKLFFEALSETRDPDIRATVRENFRGMVGFIEKSLQEGRARGHVRSDIDLRTAAWHFMAIGLAFDLIHVLGLDGELDRKKVEAWGRLYLDSIGAKPWNPLDRTTND